MVVCTSAVTRRSCGVGGWVLRAGACLGTGIPGGGGEYYPAGCKVQLQVNEEPSTNKQLAAVLGGGIDRAAAGNRPQHVRVCVRQALARHCLASHTWLLALK